MSSWSITERGEQIVELQLNLRDEKVNKLTESVLTELDRILDTFHANSSISALIITSGKDHMFIAGADINEIKSITLPEHGFEKARLGQLILSKLADLPFPTIAVIDGPCLGGGLELALCCDYRIATDHDKTKLGLPEVSLGIIPGFGGTVRLPKLIGLEASLGLILSGRVIAATKAHKLGLVDAIYPREFLTEQSTAFVNSILNHNAGKKLKCRRSKRPILERLPFGKTLVSYIAKRRLLAKTNGHYPAPLMALKSVNQSLCKSVNNGLISEATLFSQLIGKSSQTFIDLYFINEELKKNTGTTDTSITGKPITQASVLGAGLMGGGISWLFANHDIPTRVKDLNYDAILKGLQTASSYFGQAVKRRKLSAHEMGMKLHLLSGTLDYTGLEKSDVIVEAILENLEIKKATFQELEKKISETTIIASNTSSLCINSMASSLQHPERFIGMHFFSPVNRMPLVEVIPGKHTSDQTVATIVALCKQLKKTPIVVKNCPGFLINRILLPYVNEAAYLLQDGASITDIDRIMTAFGMPLGPLALADEVGLDVGIKVSTVLEAGYGERMTMAPLFSDIEAQETWKGKKTGIGFYTYKNGSKKPNSDLTTIIRKRFQKQAISASDIQDRLILTMVNEAARCLDESVVANHRFLDMAMLMGTGFPPFRGGLCRYSDTIGLSTIVQRLESLSSTVGPRFEPAPLLTKMAQSNTLFYSQTCDN